MQNPESPDPNVPPNLPPNLSKETPPASPPPISPPPVNNPYETPASAPAGLPNVAPSAPMGAPVGAPFGAPVGAPFGAPVGVPVTTDVIGQSWEMLKPQIGIWIVALLICGAISGAFNGISTVVSALSSSNPNEPNVLLTGLSILITVASGILGLLVNAGLMKMAIHHVRSGQVELGKLFDITDVIVPVIVAGILMYLAIAIGTVFLVVPGIIAFLGLSMAIPLVVDQKVDGIEALKRSWETCKPQLGALFLLFLVLGLLNIAGFCACFVGLLITSPLTQIAIALTYRNLFGIGRAESGVAPSVFPPPPIASPS